MDISRAVIRRFLVALVIATSTCLQAQAADLRGVITDFTITSWNEKDGLPAAPIFALVQDRDGYLWVGTREGLFRFDGVRFVRWDSLGHEPLPTNLVGSLCAATDGSLWVGLGEGGQITRILDDRITTFKGSDGLGRGQVLSISEEPSGVVWAGSEDGLFAFDGSRWIRWGGQRGIPDGAVLSVFSDRAGNVYVAMRAGVFARRKGAGLFERATDFADTRANIAETRANFSETADGTIWVTDPTGGYRRLTDVPAPQRSPLQGRGVRLIADHKDNLWIGTGGQGLWRVHNPGSPDATLERSISITGLMGDGIYALLEDRSGNLWAGTTEGLNRFTPRTIEQVIDLGLVRGLQTDPDGQVWIGTVDKLVIDTPGSLRPRRSIPLPAEARSMSVDEHGLWVVAGNGVYRVARDGRPRRVTLPPQAGLGSVDSLSSDGRGGLWLVAGHAIAHLNGDEVRHVGLPEMLREADVTASFVASTGDAWFAFSNGDVVVVAPDYSVNILPAISAKRPAYRTITEDGSHRIWLGGEGELTVFDHGRRATLYTSARFRVESISAVVTDDRGSLWLGSPQGVIHLEREEFDRAVADERVVPRYDIHNRSDGVAGTPLAVRFNRGAVRSADGRLWFVTTRGITIFDPHVLGVPHAAVPVRFEGATADDRKFLTGNDLNLPSSTRRLEIQYTVVNLTAPLKTRFKYRLDPFDDNWIEAGARRQAFYTNLKPGKYVFRVMATSINGDASSNVAEWRLSVAPRFYQTTAFAVLGVVSVAMALLVGWRLRERHLRKQFSLIISERARLGREIHDTLLQGLVAIALQFDSLAHDLGPTPSLQGRFLRLRDRIEEYIRQARQSIWDLHTQPRHRSLVDSLRKAGEFATDGCEIAFTFQVQGTPYQCPPLVEEQAVRIAQEAVLNAVRHAAPQRLRIDLMYEDDSLTLKIVDDGRGFKSDDAGRRGHYGITSMKDRATSIGGVLTLVSAPGRGTEVTAVLPLAS